MAGVDAVRGFNYQHAHAVQTALQVLSNESLSGMRVEGLDDVVDIEVHASDGSVVLAKQVKIRQESDTWGEKALVDVLRRWAALNLADGALFEFVTDGRLGPTGEGLRNALEAAAEGDRTAMADLLEEDESSPFCAILSRASIREEPTGVEPVLFEAEREVRAMLPGPRTEADADEDAHLRVSELYRLLSVRAGQREPDDRVVTRQEISEVLGGLAYLPESQRWPGALRETCTAAARAEETPDVVMPGVFLPQYVYGGARNDDESVTQLPTIIRGPLPALLTGSTGSGKSTAATQLRRLAADDGNVLLIAHAETYVQGRLDALAATALSAMVGQELPMQTGRQVLRDPTAILLIDGASEVPLPVRQSLQVDLQPLIDGSGAKVILVGRDVAALRSVLPSSASVQVYAMANFGAAEREEIVQRRFGCFGGQARDMVARVGHVLGDAAGNPMLFTMAVELVREGIDFTDRVSMYAATVSRLAERGGASDIDVTSGALGIVFSQLLDGGRRYANPLEWQRLLAGSVATLNGLGVELTTDIARESIDRSGVVVPIGYTQTRAPLHDSYADYFSGRAHASDLIALPTRLTPGDEQRVLFCAESGGVTEDLVVKLSRDLPFLLIRVGHHDTRDMAENAPARIGSLLRTLLPGGGSYAVGLWKHSSGVVGFLVDAEEGDRWIYDSEEVQRLLKNRPSAICAAGVGELVLANQFWRLMIKNLLDVTSAPVLSRPTSMAQACSLFHDEATKELESLNHLISVVSPMQSQESLRDALGPLGVEAVILPEREVSGRKIWPIRYRPSHEVTVQTGDAFGSTEADQYRGTSSLESVMEVSPSGRAAERLIKALNLLVGQNWIERI